MKEIDITKLADYLNPMELKSNPAIAIAENAQEINGLTIGWAGFGVLWRKPTATVYIHKTRYSKHIFDTANYYSICFFNSEYKDTIKYFGTVSGKDENKIQNCGLNIIHDLAPYFQESSLVIICKIMGKSDFDANSCDEGVSEWYQQQGVHTQYYGEIVKVLAA